MPAALESPAFERLMTEMKTVPVLGTDFNIYAPMLLVVLCMFTFYKVPTVQPECRATRALEWDKSQV